MPKTKEKNAAINIWQFSQHVIFAGKNIIGKEIDKRCPYQKY